MTSPTSIISKLIPSVILGAGLLFAATGTASAYVVCNDEGDCWHAHHRYHQPGVHLTFYDDDWYFHHNWNHDWDRDHNYQYDSDHRYRWRDYHEGRGYWQNGVWISL